jgi:hypothetical protein
MFSYHFILLAYLIHSISSFCNTFICTTIYSINLLISHFNKISTKFPFNFLSFQHLHFLFSNIITIHFFYHITIVKHTFRSISSIINRNLIFFYHNFSKVSSRKKCSKLSTISCFTSNILKPMLCYHFLDPISPRSFPHQYISSKLIMSQYVHKNVLLYYNSTFMTKES